MYSMKSAAKPKVLVLEDDPAQRQFYGDLVLHSAEFELMGSFGTASAALESMAAARPDLALVDLRLPGSSGEEFIQCARQLRPGLLCIVLTLHDDANSLWSALQAGAIGYLTKPAAPEEILRALSEAIAGGAPMSMAIARRVLAEAAAAPKTPARPAPDAKTTILTQTEERVLRLLSQGLSRKEIAHEMGLSVRTVASHLFHIYSKIHVRGQTQAALWYHEQG